MSLFSFFKKSVGGGVTKRSQDKKTVGGKMRKRVRPWAEVLEDRTVPSTINWVNRGTLIDLNGDGDFLDANENNDTDGFAGCFGDPDGDGNISNGPVDLARGVVNAAIDAWESVIENFNYSDGTNIFNLTLSMSASGTGFGGSGGVTSPATILNGKPTAGGISLSRGSDGPDADVDTDGDGTPDPVGDGLGYFLDPTPSEHSEFQGTIVNAFAGVAQTGSPTTAASPANGLADLYTVVVTEMTHALGLESRFPTLLYQSGGFLTQVTDNAGNAIPDDAEGGGVGFYWVFNSPAINHLMTSNNAGSGGSNFGPGIHSAGPPNGSSQPLTFNGKTYNGAHDTGNAIFERSWRYLVPDSMRLLLGTAYGYSTVNPAESGTMYASLNSTTEQLLVRGGTGNSDDIISVTTDFTDIIVSVNVGDDVPGTGPFPGDEDLPAFVTRVAVGDVRSIVIRAGAGVDQITVDLPFVFLDPISIDGGEGDDRIEVRQLVSISEITISGGNDDDTIVIGGGNLSASLGKTVTIDGGFGSDTVEIDNSASSTASNYFITSTGTSSEFREEWPLGNTWRTVSLNSIANLVFDAGTGDDHVIVDSTRFELTVNGNGGADTIEVGGGDFSRIRNGDITINGSSGPNSDVDTLLLHDEQGSHVGTANFYAILEDSEFVFANTFDLDFSQIDQIVLNANEESNLVIVKELDPGVSLTINANGGDDEIRVGNGNYMQNIFGAVTVNGGVGADTLTITDSADEAGITSDPSLGTQTSIWDTYTLTSTTFVKQEDHDVVLDGRHWHDVLYSALLTYSSMADVTLDASGTTGNEFEDQPATTINIHSIQSTLVVNANAGDDRIVVLGGGNPALGGDFDSNIRGKVTIHGGSGADELEIDGPRDSFDWTYYLDRTMVDGLEGADFAKDIGLFSQVSVLQFTSLESFKLDTSDDHNTFIVNGTPAGTAVTLNGRGGNDRFEVHAGGLQSSVTVNGGDPASGSGDVLAVTGTSTSNVSYTPALTNPSAGTLRVGSIPINFTGLEAVSLQTFDTLTVTTPRSYDTITVEATPSNRGSIHGISGHPGMPLPFTPLTYGGVREVTLDLASKDLTVFHFPPGPSQVLWPPFPDDTVNILADGLAIPGLERFGIRTGLGANFVYDYTLTGTPSTAVLAINGAGGAAYHHVYGSAPRLDLLQLRGQYFHATASSGGQTLHTIDGAQVVNVIFHDPQSNVEDWFTGDVWFSRNSTTVDTGDGRQRIYAPYLTAVEITPAVAENAVLRLMPHDSMTIVINAVNFPRFEFAPLFGMDISVLGTFHVRPVFETGEVGGSLRGAIGMANIAPAGGQAVIYFPLRLTDEQFIDVDSHIPGGDAARDAFLLRPVTELPALTRGNTIINGASVQFLVGNANPFGPEVILDGSLAGDADGLRIESNGNRIHGLNIRRFGGNGISISGHSNRVTGSYIGTNATGDATTVGTPDVLFAEDFEGNLSSWVGKSGGPHHGVIVADPLRPGNHALAFSALDVAGDIFGSNLTVTPGQTYLLTLEYLGRPGLGGVDGDLGGVIGFTDGLPGTQRWLAGTVASSPGAIEDDPLIDDGQWHTYAIEFNPFAAGLYYPAISGNELRIMLEDWAGSAGVPGDALFDNIRLERTVGEPTANAGDGVLILNSTGNVIGGTSAVDRNIFSGNQNGVHIVGNYVPPPPPSGELVFFEGSAISNQVLGNFIGTTAIGTAALGNTNTGVWIENSSRNWIGGAAIGSRNLISGNLGTGVAIDGYSATGNLVLGNYIGTDVTGQERLPNIDGVFVASAAAGNRIGGPTEAERNIISGNHRFGVGIANTLGTIVQGNYIGTDWTGTDRVYNITAGIGWLNDVGSVIGGTQPGEGNVISGNGFGIWMYGGLAVTGGRIMGNRIGTTANGLAALSNGMGIMLTTGDGEVDQNRVSDATIGGTAAAAGNVISGNSIVGIWVSGAAALNIRIQGNKIGTDINGINAVPNQTGVLIENAGGIQVVDNLISGNTDDGIKISGTTPATKSQLFFSASADITGWRGLNNLSYRNYFRSNLDIPGLTTDDWVAGGVFARASTALGETSNPIAYYADPHLGGTLTLDDPIHADGELIIKNMNDFDGGVIIGVFDRARADANQVGNVLGLAILEPSPHQGANGIRAAADILLADGTVLYGSWVNAPAALSLDTLYTWRYDYDPSGGLNGAGELVVEVFANGVSLGLSRIELTPAQRSVGGSFDAFGLYAGGGPARSNNPNTIELYIDSVTYTRVVGNTIQGNYIGTTADGMAALGNSNAGISIHNSTGNLIGGPQEGARNVIASNWQDVLIVGPQATNNHVAGNYIGVGADGVTGLEGGMGVVVRGDEGTGLGAPGNRIGGATEGERNVISAHRYYNVFLARTLGTTVQGNYIGTDWTGTQVVATPGYGTDQGVRVESDRDSVIGGAQPGAGNVISGHNYGVYVWGDRPIGGTQRLRIQGNRMGSTADGQGLLWNNQGVYVDGYVGDGWDMEVSDIQIGGIQSEEGNLIAGSSQGIIVRGPGVHAARIQGNKIGTDIDGIDSLRNGTGVMVDNASGVVIGGTAAGAGNVISGNDGNGVTIVGAGATGNTIQGNYIGTDVTGTARLGNGGFGVLIDDNSSGNTVGGTTAEARNVISGNLLGIQISDGSSGNVVQGNYIGPTASGDGHLGNTHGGIAVFRADANLIGGGAPGAGNIVSGNWLHGILIDAGFAPGTAMNNIVQGNIIGLDKDGLFSIGGPTGNNLYGVYLFRGASHNFIGTDVDGVNDESEGNVISGGRGAGIVIGELGTDFNVVAGNLIGTNKLGTAAVPNNDDGIRIQLGASNNLIGGPASVARNVISGNVEDGIVITDSGTTGNQLLGNLIGTDVTGKYDLGNLGSGIALSFGVSGTQITGNLVAGNDGYGVSLVQASGNTIADNRVGLNTLGEVLGNLTGIYVSSSTGVDIRDNVVSGNKTYGVLLNVASGNMAVGNKIGTDPTGMSARPNGFAGLSIQDAVSNTVQANIISGNTDRGVYLSGVGSPGNTFLGNLIGVGIDGKTAVSNTIGVYLADASFNLFDGNTISGNLSSGVVIAAAQATENKFLYNKIGTSADGTVAVGNAGYGVGISNGAHSNFIGDVIDTNGDNIADTAVGNTIGYNGLAGVVVVDASSLGNYIRGNSIRSNGGLGIDLGNDSVTVNDETAKDIDIGPNMLQNFPTLNNVHTGSQTRITGTLKSSINTTFTVDFYASSNEDPSHYGEGQRWLGSATVTSDANGTAPIPNVVLDAATSTEEYITATATDPAGNTSEFSVAVRQRAAGGGGPGGGGRPMSATSMRRRARSETTLTVAQVQPLLTEAITRWQVAGFGPAALDAVHVRIADLPRPVARPGVGQHHLARQERRRLGLVRRSESLGR